MVKARGVIIWAALALLLLSGCSRQPIDFGAVEKQDYTNAAGYGLTLPADWALREETEESSSFVSSDQTISLLISNELGGTEYYSLVEIGDMLTQQLLDQIFAEGKADTAAWSEDTYRRSLSGQDPAGKKISAELYIMEPFLAVRYYLLFVMDGDQARVMGDVVDGVIRSFKLNQDKDTIYQLMQDRAMARQAAAAEPAGEEDGD